MKRFSRASVLLILLFAVVVAALFSMTAGQYNIPFTHIIAGIAQAFGVPTGNYALTPEQIAVLYHIRLPRTLVGLLVGAGLGVSGATLQGIFTNPLADPGIIGVSAGASVGAVLAIATGIATGSIFILPAFAFVGAVGAIFLTVALSLRHGRIPVVTLLLAGVVVGMFLSAVTAAMLTIINEQKLQEYLFWTIGGLDYRRWEHVALGIPILLGTVLMLIFARHLNILALGEDEARAVGMNVTLFRMVFLFLAAFTTATSVCISGNIGFVGLVVPHIVRLLTGPDHRILLPASFLAGAVFLTFCDALGRVILPGLEIRVGIMTAFIGTPYFLYLLRRHMKTLQS